MVDEGKWRDYMDRGGSHPVSGPCALKADITDAYASNSTRKKKMAY